MRFVMICSGDEIREVKCIKYFGFFIQKKGILARMLNIKLGVVDQVKTSVWCSIQ